MTTRPTTRIVAAAVAGLLTAAALIATATAAPRTAQAADCGALFDDFHYDSHTDADLAARGWTVRANQGGPGVPGAQWPASNVSFPTVDGDRALRLTAQTDGTAAGTSHAEMFHQRKFYEGTYAARVRFSDAPVVGADGNHLVETFFTITPLAYDMDPDYGEIDFEYLPNGGWGETGNIFYQTTWETYQNDPWVADNIHTSQRRSFAGWHDLVFTVSGGEVRYYIDGALAATHGGKYYPETPMSINFNLWFIDLAAHTGGVSRYVQDVDWLYFSQNEVVAPAEAVDRVADLRADGVGHTDTVDPSCTPTGPTDPPTDPTDPPADCDGATAWQWSAVYLEGDRVTHAGRLWEANWWTQGSEPGLTAQWRDLGPC
ncbi:glycosyl hydrolase family 16 [Stackebrandtia albiflava]|uniref:Glycosyl hydrolase family 16 n=1 Tax=Stackebrandtia albiflava TaxID=406432 RepID=A0A562VEJ9_9ACTN|nr:carbohydrate-binding protein [Stackebrandtia albiflava]TWJ16316.1 glycosyl hydrolase family 16 [Stackebrandtia albiflava]